MRLPEPPRRIKVYRRPPGKRWLALSGVCMVAALAGAITLAISHGEPLIPEVPVGPVVQTDEVADQLIIKYKAPDVEQYVTQSMGEISGLQNIADIKPLQIKGIKVPAEARDLIKQQLELNPNIEYVETDRYLDMDATTPNDTAYSKQWVWPKTQTNALWDRTKGTPGLVVGMIDSGANAAHPELNGKIVPGHDFLDNGDDTTDTMGHGSMVAMTIAANSNNSQGIAGACWNCKVMPLRAIAKNGDTTRGTMLDMTEAITYAADKGLRIVNASMSGTGFSQGMQDAINYAKGKNMLLITSAGNEGNNAARYPATMDGVLSVAATDPNDQLPTFSTYGDKIKVAAPGTNFVYPDYQDTTGTKLKEGINGTSFSTPTVTGIAALLLSAFPNASRDQLYNAITTTTDTCCSGKIAGGRVNAMKAYDYLANIFGSPTPTPTPTPPAPTPTPTPPSPSPTPTPTPTPGGKKGDLNKDNKVNLTDLSTLLSNWGKSNATADLNGNGKVDLPDLSALLSNWGK